MSTSVPTALPERVVLAARSTRLRARILDNVFQLAIPSMVFVFRDELASRMAWTGSLAGVDAALIPGIFASLATWATQIACLARRGQTIGKWITGLRIVGRDGNRVGFVRTFFVRELFYLYVPLIPWVGPFVGLADALSIFADDRRCLHDRLAGTIVVRVSKTTRVDADATSEVFR